MSEGEQTEEGKAQTEEGGVQTGTEKVQMRGKAKKQADGQIGRQARRYRNSVMRGAESLVIPWFLTTDSSRDRSLRGNTLLGGTEWPSDCVFWQWATSIKYLRCVMALTPTSLSSSSKVCS